LKTQGWGFFPDIIGKDFADLKLLHPPKGWDAPFGIYAVWSKHRYFPRAMKKFVASLETLFSKKAPR
jgi:DNA-binding transcriptional LysR family regulator